jgi:Zn-dependent protease with chaperone function
MGHIKSRHLLYHSLADMLAQGVGMSASFAGLDLISTPMRLALLAWQRESEFSADRAALIASGSPNHVASMFAILGGISNRPISENTSLLEGITKIFSSHPILNERVNAVFRFANSEEYVKIVRNLNYRRMLSNAFTPICQFCGSPKAIEAIFCPECKKSQA